MGIFGLFGKKAAVDLEHFGYVMAPKTLVEERKKVRFMYRDVADGDAQNSGWAFFSGDEDDDYVNDPDNIAIYDIKTILDIDASILPYLGAAYATAYEREGENGDFKKVKGFF